MNTKDKAVAEIIEFFKSDERYLLLKGTHQHKKHALVLAVLCSSPQSLKILFRSNHSTNTETFLNEAGIGLKRSLKSGHAIRLGRHLLYTDTVNKSSWKNSPDDLNVGIIYPFDALSSRKKGKSCLDDLIRRQPSKICLVTCTDNVDLGWVNEFNPIEVVYDAEEEDPEYHKRVLDCLAGKLY